MDYSFLYVQSSVRQGTYKLVCKKEQKSPQVMTSFKTCVVLNPISLL
ncbi:Uncharacterized protein APZ42_014315 [Daphnia magna]|uniref:Uncharacterized protein n=1 Tax=Daphnia magna TaxID=35525 RepID=A0A162Q7E6_9CRUS|nr:Uncharacterized protein APZ42_014315 [Daphnia magna]